MRRFKGHTLYVVSVTVSSDCSYIVSGSFDKDIKVWDLETGTLISTLKGHKKEVDSVAISPDNQYIISGSNDKTIKVWKYLYMNS